AATSTGPDAPAPPTGREPEAPAAGEPPAPETQSPQAPAPDQYRIPAYPAAERAVRALSEAVKYAQWRREAAEPG
ncbi:hypothetical protein G3I23_34320, partial [Streptomyces sp. SID10115]